MTVCNCPLVIEIAEGGFQVEASVIAAGFEVDPDQVLFLIRSGEITSISEQGVDSDAGLHRLTFYYGNRRLRLIIGERGQIIRRSIINYGPISQSRQKATLNRP